MKCKVALFLLYVFFTNACSDRCPPLATDPLEAASVFLDACLKGEFAKASCYMIQDSINLNLLEDVRKDYEAKSVTQKKQYATASIQIENDEVIESGTHIIYYRNSYDKTARKIKVVLQNDKWIADFSYTFNGNL